MTYFLETHGGRFNTSALMRGAGTDGKRPKGYPRAVWFCMARGERAAESRFLAYQIIANEEFVRQAERQIRAKHEKMRERIANGDGATP